MLPLQFTRCPLGLVGVINCAGVAYAGPFEYMPLTAFRFGVRCLLLFDVAFCHEQRSDGCQLHGLCSRCSGVHAAAERGHRRQRRAQGPVRCHIVTKLTTHKQHGFRWHWWWCPLAVARPDLILHGLQVGW